MPIVIRAATHVGHHCCIRPISNALLPTAYYSTALTSKIQEVDAMAGLSTKAYTVNKQYHTSKKWISIQTSVLKPTTAKTMENTKEVSAGMKEKVALSEKRALGGL